MDEDQVLNVWSYSTLKNILRIMHCLNEGHYEDLDKDKKETVDLDVERVMAQFEHHIRSTVALQGKLEDECRYSEEVETALMELVESRANNKLIPGLPSYITQERDAWKEAERIVAQLRNDPRPE